jgi:hypothetical protein
MAKRFLRAFLPASSRSLDQTARTNSMKYPNWRALQVVISAASSLPRSPLSGLSWMWVGRAGSGKIGF